jgi:hypothetical protein
VPQTIPLGQYQSEPEPESSYLSFQSLRERNRTREGGVEKLGDNTRFPGKKPFPPDTPPGRSNFSSVCKNIRNDVSGFRLGGTPPPTRSRCRPSMMMNPTLGQEAVAPLPISRCRPNSSVLGDPSVQTNMSAQSSMFSQKLGQRLIGLNRNNFGSGLPAESLYSDGKAKQDRHTQCLGRLSAI